MAMTVALKKPLLVFLEEGVKVGGWVEGAVQYVSFSRKRLKENVPRFISFVVNIIYQSYVPTFRLFGRKNEQCPVIPLDREEAGVKTNEIIKGAKSSIRNISVHGVTYAPDTMLRIGDPIDMRVLLLKYKSRGYERIHSSPYDRPDHTEKKMFSIRYRNWHDIAIDEKKDIVRCYSGIPWFRGTIVDGTKAIFLLTPNLCYGPDVQLWYTEDQATCQILTAIFDEIWEDPRTI